MQESGIVAQIEAACRELGLDSATLSESLKQAAECGGEVNRAAAILAQANERLRVELEKAISENQRLAARERAIVELLGGESPDKILHDLRNVLNELMLLKSIDEMKPKT